MNTQHHQTPAILVGLFQDVAWVRVTGKGCFQISPQLRQFAEQIVARGQLNLVVDLEDCTVMDSTFMGTITGIATRLLKAGRFQIINANPRNLGLLRTMGLDHILDVDQSGECWKEERKLVRQNVTQPLDEIAMSKVERTELVMEAHEALCQANAANTNRFRDVIEYLKRDLDEAGETAAAAG